MQPCMWKSGRSTGEEQGAQQQQGAQQVLQHAPLRGVENLKRSVLERAGDAEWRCGLL
jgi:hypothetical protein